MSSEADNQLEMMAAYTNGRTTFEQGRYRESVEWLIQAIAQVNRNSQIGGEMQMWLVSAYEAVGQSQEAIALCRQLQHHAHWETRQQSKRLLYILEAPKLQKKTEWLTQIPDLSTVNEQDQSERMVVGNFARSAAKPKSDPEPIDLSQVDMRESNLVWVALVGLLVVLGGLVWLG